MKKKVEYGKTPLDGWSISSVLGRWALSLFIGGGITLMIMGTFWFLFGWGDVVLLLVLPLAFSIYGVFCFDHLLRLFHWAEEQFLSEHR